MGARDNSLRFTVWDQMQKEEQFGIQNFKIRQEAKFNFQGGEGRRTRENTLRCSLFAISVFFGDIVDNFIPFPSIKLTF